MRPVRHLTPRYVFDRIVVFADARRHPDRPWWTRGSVQLMDDLLRPTDRCLEWGSGRSTAWLAARTAAVQSVEHDERWFRSVTEQLAAHPNASVTHRAAQDDYVAVAGEVGAADVVVVDGIHRDRCALAALEVVRPGGLLLLDNAERYVPSRSRSPQAIGDRHESAGWQQFDQRTAQWRCLRTSDGISDTYIYLKP